MPRATPACHRAGVVTQCLASPVCCLNCPPRQLSPLSSPRVLYPLFRIVLIIICSRLFVLTTGPHCPSQQIMCFPPFNKYSSVPTNLQRASTTCLFFFSLSLSFFSHVFLWRIPSLSLHWSHLPSPPQGRPLPSPLLSTAARKRAPVSATTQR